jgi:hypothetical protein
MFDGPPDAAASGGRSASRTLADPTRGTAAHLNKVETEIQFQLAAIYGNASARVKG